jgi:hypothetical protein
MRFPGFVFQVFFSRKNFDGVEERTISLRKLLTALLIDVVRKGMHVLTRETNDLRET